MSKRDDEGFGEWIDASGWQRWIEWPEKTRFLSWIRLLRTGSIGYPEPHKRANGLTGPSRQLTWAGQSRGSRGGRSHYDIKYRIGPDGDGDLSTPILY